MSSRKIELLLTARNMTAKAFSAVGRSIKSTGKMLSSFGRSALKVGKWFTAGFAAAGAAIVAAAYKAQEFNKQVGQISTLSKIPIREIKREVISLSAQFGLAKDELTNGLYDALSSGVPDANIFEFMRVASKMAIGGAASTAESVDLLTTAINSFKIPVEQAELVSDALFTTVKLGKTTVSELAGSFAQVAPLASASGIKITDLFSAIATLTKQGTPTAQAMTQIRGAIISMNEQLGDGWTKSMSLQQGFEAMATKAKGSTTALKAMMGRIEGTLAILATTGSNAQSAADDLNEIEKSAGEAQKAFAKMADLNPFDKLKQSINGAMLSAGDAALTLLAPTIIKAADAVKAFGESVAAWMNSEKFKAVLDTVEGIVSAMATGGQAKADVGKALVNVVIAGFAVAAEGAVSIIKTAAPVIGKMIGAALKSVWEAFKPVTNSEAEAAAKQLGIDPKSMRKSGRAYRADKQRVEAIRDRVRAQAKLNRQQKIYEEAGLGDAPLIDGETEAQAKLNTEVDKLVKLAEKYKKVAAEPEVPAEDPEANQTITQAEQVGADDEAKRALANEEAKRDELIALTEKQAKLEVDIEKAKQDEILEAKKKGIEDQLTADEKALEEATELAKRRVTDVIDENKKKEDHEKGLADDQKKADKLRGMQARGIKISKRDQEFLRQAEKIANAGAAVPGLNEDIERAKKSLAELGNQTKTLNSLLTEQKANGKMMKQLMAAG